MDQITNANDFVMDRLNFTMDIESGHEKLSNTTWSDKPILLSTKVQCFYILFNIGYNLIFHLLKLKL